MAKRLNSWNFFLVQVLVSDNCRIPTVRTHSSQRTVLLQFSTIA